MMRVFSAIQPTGCLHLGNYLGAVRAWTRLLTASSSSLFAIADLHALTTPTDPVTLARDIEMLAASLLACGIDPHKCTLFQQSDVPQHAELTWILACQLQMNRLNTMTQFKVRT
jgi:tryptophanyl-tRNA synthetase